MFDFKKRIVLLAVLLIFMISVIGCDNKVNLSDNTIKIGSTYNTKKILQDDTEYVNLGKELRVSMAKGETEGGQIIITPEKNIKSYNAKISDLEDSEGNVFSKTNVEIFVQKYLKLEYKTNLQTNMDYLPGFYPDMLLPLDIAVDFNENKVSAGKNQGLTIEFTTTSETVAGNYTGTLTLDIDGKNEIVPVYLTVWDIDITKSYGRSSVSWWPTGMKPGENAFTPELYKEYYETMLYKYKTNLAKLPGSYMPDTMTENVLKYWDHPDFTSYAIPADFTVSRQFNTGRFMDYLHSLSLASEPGKILLEKAYVYNIDEPNHSDYPRIHQTREAIYWAEEEVFLRLQEEGYFEQFDSQYKEDFYKAITNISLVIPVHSTAAVNAIGPAINTYCVVIDQYDTERYREIYRDMANQTSDRGGTTWFYTCVQPLYPYPSHHIDDALIGSRIMRWMQKSYDLEGYLYWALSSYETLQHGAGWVWADPYEEPVRYNNGGPGTTGDGYLVYPGAKYNHNTFFGSLRLTTLRDSQEDLNMLYVLDNIIKEYASFYELSDSYFDMNEYVQEIYDSLFTGTRYEKNDEIFYMQREKLVEIILALQNDYKLIYKTTMDKTTATVNLFTASGYTLKVDGEIVSPISVQGGGNHYILNRELNSKVYLNVEIFKDDELVGNQMIFVGNKTQIVDLNSDKISVSEDSTKQFLNDKLTVNFVSKGVNIIEKRSFNPALVLPESMFGSSYTNIKDMTCTITNPSDKDIRIFAQVKSGFNSVIIKEIVIPANETITFTINNIGSTRLNITSAVEIQFFVDNIDANYNLLPDRQLVFESIVFSTLD